MTEQSEDKRRARLINAVLDRVDVDALIGQVELDDLLARIDVNQLLDRVDVDRLLDRVDVNRLLDGVDLDRLLDDVDVNRLVARVDVEAVTSRANVGGLVAQSTSQVAGSTLDIARRQAAGLDTLIMGLVDRLLGPDCSARSAARTRYERGPRGDGRTRRGQLHRFGSDAGSRSWRCRQHRVHGE